jgi:hypothetical protein
MCTIIITFFPPVCCLLGSQPKGKQSDWGSSGCTYQAQQVPPCTAGSVLKDGTLSNQQGNEPKVGSVGDPTVEEIDEVDSPVKGQSREGGQLQTIDVVNATALTPPDCNVAVVVVQNPGT